MKLISREPNRIRLDTRYLGEFGIGALALLPFALVIAMILNFWMWSLGVLGIILITWIGYSMLHQNRVNSMMYVWD